MNKSAKRRKAKEEKRIQREADRRSRGIMLMTTRENRELARDLYFPATPEKKEKEDA